MNKNFLNILKGLSDPAKREAVKTIMAKYKKENAVDSKFYSSPAKIKATMENLFDVINTTDPFLEALIKIEASSPYSIFSYILLGKNGVEGEDFSDILFHGYGYNLSNDKSVIKERIPEELLDIYQLFLNHFIENIMFIASKKFDTANGIMDAEIDKFRFNLIHKTLNNNDEHIIVVRKQTAKVGAHVSDEYIQSIGASQNQIDAIHRYALDGNFIVFGQTGSGKTTLLKYMGNYKLNEKRNLCTIEDTPELNIDVPISLVTNHHFKIRDLFVASLRQNPSTVLIGETRTDEIVDILNAALTTNVGTTIHANSFLRAIQRIIFMSAERKLPSNQIKDLINASIDCFIFMDNRKVKEIWVHKDEINDNVLLSYEKVI